MININDVIIREIYSNEISILEDLLYEAVFQPDSMNRIPRSIIDVPEVRAYIKDFGQKADDYCLVACLKRNIIGGVWIRILADGIKGFGNIDNKTPEFAISVFNEYRNNGIGTHLMKEMVLYLKNKYSQASLSVQKENYAVKMYQNLGFKILYENEKDYVMLMTF